jgi:hypothetical protein
LQCFGIACILWGLLTLCKSNDKAVLCFNILHSVIFAANMGLTLTGKAWRPKVQVEDGSWAMVPTVAHSFFAVLYIIAFATAAGPTSSAKGKTD